MHPFALAFVVALLAHLATQWWLARRQIAHVRAHRATIPAGFEGAVTHDEHAKAADYACARQRLGVLEALYDTAVVLAMTLGGGIAKLGTWASSLVPPGVPAGTLQLLARVRGPRPARAAVHPLPDVRPRAALRLQPHGARHVHY